MVLLYVRLRGGLDRDDSACAEHKLGVDGKEAHTSAHVDAHLQRVGRGQSEMTCACGSGKNCEIERETKHAIRAIFER